MSTTIAFATAIPEVRPRRRRQTARVALLYAFAIVFEFRWTLIALLAATSIGAAIFAMNPIDENASYPSFGRAVFGAWMSLLAQPLFTPGPWFVGVIDALYPLFGFVLIGEGIVRFGLLMLSRRRGEREWMKVMASTHRDHIILAGLGHLGLRIFESLHAANVEVVVLEANEDNPFIAEVKATGAPILIRNMQDDQALIDAGIEHARAIIIATNKDMANLEVALDSRRMNPRIRVLMRLYDQRIAQKIAGAVAIDAAFSSSSLAAPIVAAMSLESRVLSSLTIGGVPHTISEIVVAPESELAGKRVDQIELKYSLRVLTQTPREGELKSPPTPATTVAANDLLVIHVATSKLTLIANAASRLR